MLTWILLLSLPFFLYLSLSSLTSTMPFKLHPISAPSRYRYDLSGQPILARSRVAVHRRTSFMSSSLVLQQCHECLVRLIWMILEIGGELPYSYCFVCCCFRKFF